MFSQRTTFVIGAGASCELDLPSGDGLLEQIKAILEPDHSNIFGFKDEVICDQIQYLTQKDGGHMDMQVIEQLQRARDVILGTIPWTPSIDNLLHTHSSDEWVVKLGKAVIARLILEAENQSHFFPENQRLRRKPRLSDLRPGSARGPTITGGKLQETWLRPFSQILFSRVLWPDFKHQLSKHRFIIFNYDRCFEEFLFRAIRANYDVSEDEAAEVASNALIIHPYGDLGKLPWDRRIGGPEVLPFGAAMRECDPFELGSNLRTFTESVDDEMADLAKAYITHGQHLVFLGFGFLRQNLNLIRPEVRPATQIFATTFGMPSPNVDQTRQILSSMLKGSYKDPYLEAGKCADLFKNYSMALSA